MKNRIIVDFNLDGDLNDRNIYMLKNDLKDYIKNHELTYYANDIFVDVQIGSYAKGKNAKLAPCPFCGGTVDHFHTEQLTFHKRRYQFRCNKCGGYFFFPSETPYKSAEANKREAVKIWNTRMAKGGTE